MNATAIPLPSRFSRYQMFVVGVLALMQFAVVLDFMLMAPLGAIIMPALDIGPAQFGLVVSAYAFSAGVSGLLTAGFADRFDRKKLLLFFYAGFIVGTLWCGLAGSFATLLIARIVTGLFGGVIGSIVLAISADMFPMHMRGRVMGLIQTAFAASQVLGIPVGLYLSNRWSWHVPFLAMAAIGALGGMVVAWRMQPVVAHLAAPAPAPAPASKPWTHLLHTVTEPRYLLVFATTALLATGGFMLMPFSSAYIVGNLGIGIEHLATVYLVTGLFAIFCGPLIGRLSDSVGKFRVFIGGTLLTVVMVLIYTNLGVVSLPVLVAVNVVMYVGIFSRMVPFQALASAVPAPNRRGAFTAVSASIQQLSGGVASVVAGHIVTLGPHGALRHFDVLGYIVVSTSVAALALLTRLRPAG